MLVYSESFATQLEAIKRERQLKRWSHAKKNALINGDIETLRALSKRRIR
jgi:putative endonuclease